LKKNLILENCKIYNTSKAEKKEKVEIENEKQDWKCFRP